MVVTALRKKKPPLKGEVARRAGGVLAWLLPSITTGKLLNFEFIWTDIPLPAGAFQVKSQNPSVSANAEPAPLAGEPKL